MKYIIHVGFHKTGTTYLQKNLFLKNRFGFFCPWTVSNGIPIEKFVLENDIVYDPKRTKQQFDDDVIKMIEKSEMYSSNKPVSIISHEDLSGYPLFGRYYGYAVADRLKSTFENAKIIIGIREQKSMVRSLYGQYIRQDGEWDLDVFFSTDKSKSGFRSILHPEHIEYHYLVSKYINLFGVENVLVLPIELLKANQDEFHNKLGNFCGTDQLTCEKLTPENVGLGSVALQMNRILNKYAKRNPDWNGDWDKVNNIYKIKGKFVEFVNGIAPDFLNKIQERKLQQICEVKTKDYYKKSNKLLSDMIGINLAELGYDT